MGNLIIKQGDLFTTRARGIGHGVNVDGKMGAGIAVPFRQRFPDMYAEYVKKCESKELRPGGVFPWQANEVPPQFIYNIASQDRPGPNARMEWLSSGIADTLTHAQAHGIDTVALPLIGGGIGGLSRNEIVQVLRGRLHYSPIDIELWLFNPGAR